MAVEAMMWLLTWMHDLTGSWGLAIIGITVLTRVVMHPLTQKQMISMKKMQELAPRMKMLQEKYADDKDMQSKKIMELYKENNVNPVAGCLPMLLQLPIFILLFNVLTTHDFGGATFWGINLSGSFLSTVADAINLVDPESLERIPVEELGILVVIFSAMSNPPLLFANLGTWLPNAVLIIANSVVMWYQQRLSSVGNPQMAMLGWLMPIMMLFICLGFPGGVVFYWGVSSLLGVLTQVSVMRKTHIEMQKKPVLLQEKPTHKETE